jgi:hypothetical protein
VRLLRSTRSDEPLRRELPLDELRPEVLRPDELREPELRLDELPDERDEPLERPELRERFELDEPDDFDLLRADPEEPPERLFDPEALPRPEPLDPELRERDPELREPEPCRGCFPSWPCCSSSSSPLLSSFLATVTAAGTAMPTAAPARAFLPVERPSCSLSFAITSLLASLAVSCLRGPR